MESPKKDLQIEGENLIWRVLWGFISNYEKHEIQEGKVAATRRQLGNKA